ncbi:MAG: AAA family ATPase [Pseudobdellovibrionaceae bacterium]
MAKDAASAKDTVSLEDKIEAATETFGKVRQEIGQVIFGQEDVVNLTLTAIFAGGHALLVGVPGLAKTLLVETLGTVLGMDAKRVQCTPDLMPADIIGTEVLEEGDKGVRSFRFIEGPVFTNILMADEINRASPRTQSALLQAMQEKRVSVAGHEHILNRPFHVLATQNPIEQEGTYPLPEAQLDRFLMQIDVSYPDYAAERMMLLKTTAGERAEPKAILNAQDILDLQSLIANMPTGENIVEGILRLIRGLRPGDQSSKEVNDYVMWAPGPRAAQALLQAVKAYALLDGRLSPSLEDVQHLALPVLKHRMALTPLARSERVKLRELIAATL